VALGDHQARLGFFRDDRLHQIANTFWPLSSGWPRTVLDDRGRLDHPVVYRGRCGRCRGTRCGGVLWTRLRSRAGARLDRLDGVPGPTNSGRADLCQLDGDARPQRAGTGHDRDNDVSVPGSLLGQATLRSQYCKGPPPGVVSTHFGTAIVVVTCRVRTPEAHRSCRQAETPPAAGLRPGVGHVPRLPSEPAIVSATTAVMPANVTDLMTRASPSVEPGQPWTSGPSRRRCVAF